MPRIRTHDLAPALIILYNQINATWPSRNTASDGSIGDQAHSTTTSNHNPKRIANRAGMWVTALDITHDPGNGVNIDTFTDELVNTRDNRINELIANRLILNTTTWTWKRYSGNPHTSHFHISVVRDGRAFDTRLWQCASLVTIPAPEPTGPEFIPSMEFGERSDAVRRLQVFMTTVFPSYNQYNPTGFYGEQTSAGIREFQRRTGIAGDGRNVGPQTKQALWKFGYRG